MTCWEPHTLPSPEMNQTKSKCKIYFMLDIKVKVAEKKAENGVGKCNFRQDVCKILHWFSNEDLKKVRG